MSTSDYGYAHHQYIRDCAPVCKQSGQCHANTGYQALMAAQKLINQSKEMSMTAALWCDQGDHAFSARDKDRQELTLTEYDDDGHSHQTTRTICGEHAKALGIKAIDK